MTESPAAIANAIVTQVRLLSWAFAMGVLLFAGVATVLVTGDSGPLGFVPIDGIVEWAVAAIAIGVGFGGGSIGRMASVFASGASVDEIRQKAMTGSIIASAFRESAGLVGGVMILNSGNLMVGLALAGISCLLLVTGGPDASAIESAVRRARIGGAGGDDAGA